MTAGSEASAAARVAWLRDPKRNPAAVDLATLCSLAVRVEPGLLRQLRLLLPGADVTAESDLWASDLLSGASVRGIALDPAVAELLRGDLAQPRWAALRTRTRQLVLAHHRDLDWSLRLEEEVAWLSVEGGPAADRSADLLFAAVARLVGAASKAASISSVSPKVGIARWLLGALARLPRSVLATEAADVARLGAAVHLDAGVPEQASGIVSEQWLPWLLATAGGVPHEIHLRFTPGRLHVNASGPDAVTIDVPSTDPLVLDVDWSDGRRARTRRLRFRPGEAVTLDVAGDEIEMTTLAGDRFRLRLARAGDRAESGGFDFAEARRACRPCLGREDRLSQLAAEMEKRPMVVITGGAGTGKTVLAGALADRLEAHGWIVAQHFYGVEPAWDDDALVARSIEAQLSENPPPEEDPRHPPSVRVARAMAVARMTRPVLLLLDGVTWTRPGSSTRKPEDLPLPAGLDPGEGMAVVMTSRDAPALRPWLRQYQPFEEDLDRIGSRAVCAAILSRHAATLRVAFGTDLDRAAPPDPVESATPPHEEELLALAGGNPGRLVGIVAWALDQPAGRARLERVPPTITVRAREVLRELDKEFSTANLASWLGGLAVAGANFTVGDAERLGPAAAFLDRAVAVGVAAAGGPLDDPSSELRPTHAGLIDVLSEHLGPTVRAEGHSAHNTTTWLDRVEWASPYQVANAITHALGAGDVTKAARWCGTGRFLDRRAREGGVAAMVDDLRRVAEVTTQPEMIALHQAAQSVAAVAATRPEWIVPLLVNERLRRRSSDGLITPFAPALLVQSVHSFGPPAMTPVLSGPVAAATGPSAGSPDSPVVLSLGNDLSIRWETGEQRVEMPRPATHVAAVSNTRVVAADATTLHWLGANEVRTETELPIRPVAHLAGEESWIAVGSSSGMIAASGWPGDPRSTWLTLAGHGQAVTAFVHASGRLLSASLDGTVRVWDLGSGSQVRVFRRHRASVRHLLVAGDGTVISAGDDGRVLSWDPVTCRVRRAFRGHEAPVTAVARLHDEYVLTAGRDGTVWRWHLDGSLPGEDRLVAGRAPITHLAVVPGGRSFVTADEGGWLAWWDAEGAPMGERRTDALGPVTGLFTSLELQSNVLVAHAEGLARFEPRTSPGGGDDPFLGALALSGRRAVVGSPLGGTRRVDVDSGIVEATERSNVVALASVREGVVTARRDGGLYLNPLEGLESVAINFDRPYELLAPVVDSTFLAVPVDNAVVERHEGVREPPATWPAPARPTAIAAVPVVQPDPPLGLSALLDLTPDELAIVLWARFGLLVPLPPRTSEALERIYSDAAARGELSELVGAALRMRPQSVLPSITSTEVVAGDANGTVTVVSSTHPVSATTGSAPVTALAAEVGRVIVGTADGVVLRWHLGGTLPVVVGRHDGPVRALTVVRPGYVLSAGDDRTLRLWDVDEPALHDIVVGREPFHAVATTADGSTVVARHGPEELWVFGVQSHVFAAPAETLEPLTEVVVQAGWGVERAGQVGVWVDLTARPAVPVEVRSVRLTAAALAPAGQPEVEFDDGGFPALDEAGRLRSPVQVLNLGPMRIRLRQAFAAVDPPEPLAAVLQMTIVTPTHRTERVWEARLQFVSDESAAYAQQNPPNTAGRLAGPPAVTIAGLLPRPEQSTRAFA